jgi:ribosomal protein L35
MNHILEKKSPTQKRRLNKKTELTGGDLSHVKRQLGL